MFLSSVDFAQPFGLAVALSAIYVGTFVVLLPYRPVPLFCKFLQAVPRYGTVMLILSRDTVAIFRGAGV